MARSPYVPHAIFAIAMTSISINIVGHRRWAQEEQARLQGRITLLEQMRDQLRSPNPSIEEVERLKRLLRPDAETDRKNGRRLPEVVIGWRDVWFGRPLPKDDEMSEWDKQDLEKLKAEMAEKS